jgi:hypothetical protein
MDVLFTIEEISNKGKGFDAAFDSTSNQAQQSFSGKASEFPKYAAHVCQDDAFYLDFMTAGKLSLHQMIESIIQQLGPCKKLYLSTWAIKEVAARSLFNLKENKLLEELHGIFDYRVKTVDSQAFNFIEPHFSSVALVKNHSKMLLLDFGAKKIVILSSANLSNNPRIETGFVTANTRTYNFHLYWMKEILNGTKI